jgi:hypothetical protein
MEVGFENPLQFKESPESREQQEQKIRILVMLGARLLSNGNEDRYPPRFPLVNESQKEGMPKEVAGGDSRMRAIEQVYKEYIEENSDAAENFRVFTTGGIEKVQTDSGTRELSRAEEAEKKLSQKYGLPEDILEALPSGGSTLGNAAALAKWVNQHYESIGDVHDIEIVTNEFHMTRAWIMFTMAFYKNEYGRDLELHPHDVEEVEAILENTLSDEENGDRSALEQIQKIYEKYISGLSLRVKPLVVEDVLVRKGDSGKKYAEMIRNNTFVLATRKNERTGIQDLLHGRYQVK